MSDRGRSYSHDEAVAALKAIRQHQGTDDRGFPAHIVEDDHFEADAILLGLIGSAEVRDAFDQVGKWYA